METKKVDIKIEECYTVGELEAMGLCLVGFDETQSRYEERSLMGTPECEVYFFNHEGSQLRFKVTRPVSTYTSEVEKWNLSSFRCTDKHLTN